MYECIILEENLTDLLMCLFNSLFLFHSQGKMKYLGGNSYSINPLNIEYYQCKTIELFCIKPKSTLFQEYIHEHISKIITAITKEDGNISTNKTKTCKIIIRFYSKNNTNNSTNIDETNVWISWCFIVHIYPTKQLKNQIYNNLKVHLTNALRDTIANIGLIVNTRCKTPKITNARDLAIYFDDSFDTIQPYNNTINFQIL